MRKREQCQGRCHGKLIRGPAKKRAGSSYLGTSQGRPERLTRFVAHESWPVTLPTVIRLFQALTGMSGARFRDASLQLERLR